MNLLKKYLWLQSFTLIFGFNCLLSYIPKIHNMTQGSVRIIFKFAGGDTFCPDKDIELKPGQQTDDRETNVGGCCVTELQITGITDPIKGTKSFFTSRTTGYNMACRDFSVRLVQSLDGRIVPEELWPKDANGYYSYIRNNTDGEVMITVIYSGHGVYTPASRLIGAGEQIRVFAAEGCVESVEVIATSGQSKGQVYSLKTPRQGLGMTCASVHMTISNASDGSLIAQANVV
jgi:hypothetical protein